MIGKVGVVLSLILAAFALNGQINPDKPKIKAICNLLRIPERPAVPVVPSEPVAPSVPEQGKVGDKKQRNATPVDSAKLALGKKIDATFSETVSIFTIPPIVLTCDISNRGSQEAKDVVLDLPFVAKVAKFADKLLPSTQLSDKSVSLGVIRPNARVSLFVWGESLSYSLESEDNYSISYAGGVGAFLLPTTSYGITGKVARFLDQLLREPIIALLFLLPFMLIAFVGYKILKARFPGRIAETEKEVKGGSQTATGGRTSDGDWRD